MEEHENEFRYNAQEEEIYEGPAPLNEAGMGTRFGNYILDLICIYALSFGLAFLDIYAETNIIVDMNEYVFGFLITFLYYLVFEGISSRTPAKWITKTIVVDLDGQRPSFGNILGRSLSRLIPFDGLSFLFMNGVGWHDTISHTRVVFTKNTSHPDHTEIIDSQ